MEIRETDDYSIFKRIEGNRSIDRSLVTKLVKSMQRRDLQQQRPVLVNEDMAIIDGQHTYEARKQMKLPVYYIISKNTDIDDVIELNINKRGWHLADYVRSYAERGKANYSILLSFMDKYGLSPSTAGLLLSNRDMSTKNSQLEPLTSEIKTGNFIIKDVKRAEELANSILEIGKYCTSGFWKTREFVYAVSTMYGTNLMDRLVERAKVWNEATNKKIDRGDRAIDYLRQFEDVLNYDNRGEKVRLY